VAAVLVAVAVIVLARVVYPPGHADEPAGPPA
jgi:hypothetical protein